MKSYDFFNQQLVQIDKLNNTIILQKNYNKEVFYDIYGFIRKANV